MSIDSEQARYSVVGISGINPGVYPSATYVKIWRQAAGHGYAGWEIDVSDEATPADDDADVVVTARLDRDAATVRPPRITALTAVDSLANSALEGPERADLDAHEVRLERIGQGSQEGSLYRLVLYSNRGADALAVARLVLDYDAVRSDVDIMAADTTTGTDRDGAHVRVPQLLLRTAMDSLRNAALTIGGGSTRETREQEFMTANTLDIGNAIRLFVEQAGRGGDAYAIASLEIEYDKAGEELTRAKEI